eukprot:CAMPEP_0202343424 /NCGR_PEP_ID=MMETSP1126-20121109/3550_1 /ASSEMBLY_ACC=CAM_ASM_000457 /TAXON_ID=3047 /ORGANISM="Dunaliella tertiolecta, Strain CCMP1320" /LENGTH=507 /DNA_ID=CAMNT_0048934489 /DNA_START=41 /DNA_END=1564 /DNA_ORIENTATION=+
MSGLPSSTSRYKSPPAEPPHSSIFRKRARLSPAVSDPDLEGSWPLKRHVTEFYASDLNWACTTNTHDPETRPVPSSSAFADFTGAANPLPIPCYPLPSLLNASPPPGNDQQQPQRPGSASEHSMEEEVMLASGSSRMSTDMPCVPMGSSPPSLAAVLQPSLEVPEEVTSRAAFLPSFLPASASPNSSGSAASGYTGSMGLPPIPSPIPGISRRRNNNAMFIGMPTNEASDAVPASPSDPGASIMTNLRKTALLRSTSMLSMQKCMQASGIGSGNAQSSPQQQLMQPQALRSLNQQQQQQAALLQMQQMQHDQEFKNWPPSAHQQQPHHQQPHHQRQQQQQQQQQQPPLPQGQQPQQPPKQQEAKQPWHGLAGSASPASSINVRAAAGAAFSLNHGPMPPSTAKVPLPTSPIAQSLAAKHGTPQPAPQTSTPMLMHPSPRHFPALNVLTQMDRPEQDPPPFHLQPLGGQFRQNPLLAPAMDSPGLQQQESVEDLPSAIPILGSDAMSL